ncbi:MAG: macro domain-containing protein [Candidatus Acidiferrales bacterium]
MIREVSGNLLGADVEALVNTVNTFGVMGRGVALQFKQAFPANFSAYEAACRRGEVEPGRMFVFRRDTLGTRKNPRFIINFPTKRDWRSKSRMEDIEAGLRDLVKVIREEGIQSIALPPLGCGSGRLKWTDVRTKIKEAFESLPEVLTLIYPPTQAPAPEAMRIGTERPRMTPCRAVLLILMHRYALPGYRLSLLEIQKLAYFLQASGEPLDLKFHKQQYGPYTETLHHVLQRLEGHFITGYGDRSQRVSIALAPEAVKDAEALLAMSAETQERFKKVARLIDGFETPYGMELLASVHWVAMVEDRDARTNAEKAVQLVHSWNARKHDTFRPEHIKIAWDRLREEQWI